MRRISANGIHLAVEEAGSGYPVVLLHGFPELAYSWRHQLPALAGAGFHAIAPDLRGYGSSDKPDAIDEYRLTTLVADITGLLDALDLERVALVGHDWGSIVAWTMALLHPERIERLVSLNVPYRGHCNSFPSTDYITEHLSDRFGYVLMLQEPGVAEAWFGSDPAGKLRAMYARAAAEPGFLSEAEFQTYLAAFTAGGITGPANYYRNIDRNERDTARLADAPITMPTLMVAADRDPVLPAALTEGMERWVPDLRVRVIENCGHWTQQEQPDALSAALVDFLHDLPGS
ncbi:MAG: alpha/beta hydrolase [Acidimicrobiia bacterium]|nr:alpha/beta hydrolase [Acidimicrobiia bacterium]MBT8215986.1 alpha/beta hydrolase [Acidimicrobiia bacterium]NNF10771.1 alpha/beta hydrolase [Acidimicrobiia bacterium]NNL69200.1 alpha/beta hydrolase [Acidimicrobiia bacterium]